MEYALELFSFALSGGSVVVGSRAGIGGATTAGSEAKSGHGASGAKEGAT